MPCHVLPVMPQQLGHKDRTVKSLQVILGSSFEKKLTDFVPNAIYQDSALELSSFWRRIFLSVFTIYGHSSHLVQWSRTIRTNCQYPFNRRPLVKYGENRSSCFRKEDFQDYMYTVLYKCIAQRQGQITTWDKILIVTETFYYSNHTW